MGIDILTFAAARAGKGGGGSASKYKQPDWGSEGEKIILPEATYDVDPDAGMGFIAQEFTIVAGSQYDVVYNGTVFSCVAVDTGGEEGIALGNVGAAMGTGNTGEPFLILATHDEESGLFGAIFPLDGSASVTVSISSNVVHKIPAKYLDTKEPLIVMCDADGLISGFTHEMVVEAIKQGRTVFLKSTSTEGFNGCVGIDANGRPVFIAVNQSQLYTQFVNEDGHITSKIYDANDANGV